MSDQEEVNEKIAEMLDIDEKLKKIFKYDDMDDKDKAALDVAFKAYKAEIIKAVKNIPQRTNQWIAWYNYEDTVDNNERLKMLQELANELITDIKTLSEYPGLIQEFSEDLIEVFEEYQDNIYAQQILETLRQTRGGKISKRKVRKSKRKQHKPRKSKRGSCKSTKKRNTKKH